MRMVTAVAAFVTSGVKNENRLATAKDRKRILKHRKSITYKLAHTNVIHSRVQFYCPSSTRTRKFSS